MEHITILMSTFNGEKYIVEQIESLFSQERVIADIIVRDDGSTDKTKDILNDYQTKGALKWYSGKNIGAAKSFLDLVFNAPDSDYYAFCDQDDVWLPDKLFTAIERIKDYPAGFPALYYGRPRLVDSELNMIKQSDMALHRMLSFKSAIINSNATGCTMVFNRTLLQKVRQVNPDYLDMHDSWFHKVCLIFNGNIFFDDDVHILYRQHSENAIGIDTSPSARLKQHLRSFMRRECARSKVIISLYECYENYMNEETKELCRRVKNYKHSLRDKFKILFDRTIRTDYPKRNLLFRIALLINIF